MNEPSNTNNSKKGNIEQYIIGKTIGEGTFGKVKIATHILTGEKVAIKILEKIKILEESDKVRIDLEIKILKSLMHKNIIQIYSVIENLTTIFLIMEYVNGGELFEYICLKQKLSELEACKFYHDIISGIEYLHKQGIVHRDLKPENLLLNSKKDIKIVDFGLSNIYKKGELLITPCGSPCYAAPEMILGKHYNGLYVDIWSSGIILFAMSFGYLPFDDPDTDILYKKITDGKFSVPSNASSHFKDFIKKVLITDPSKRIGIESIKGHPWFNLINQNIPKGLFIKKYYIPVDEEVLEEMAKLNFEIEEVRELVMANRHNHITTTYNLILKKQIRLGKTSIADLVSEEYIRFINDPKNIKESFKNKKSIDSSKNNLQISQEINIVRKSIDQIKNDKSEDNIKSNKINSYENNSKNRLPKPSRKEIQGRKNSGDINQADEIITNSNPLKNSKEINKTPSKQTSLNSQQYDNYEKIIQNKNINLNLDIINNINPENILIAETIVTPKLHTNDLNNENPYKYCVTENHESINKKQIELEKEYNLGNEYLLTDLNPLIPTTQNIKNTDINENEKSEIFNTFKKDLDNSKKDINDREIKGISNLSFQNDYDAFLKTTENNFEFYCNETTQNYEFNRIQTTFNNEDEFKIENNKNKSVNLNASHNENLSINDDNILKNSLKEKKQKNNNLKIDPDKNKSPNIKKTIIFDKKTYNSKNNNNSKITKYNSNNNYNENLNADSIQNKNKIKDNLNLSNGFVKNLKNSKNHYDTNVNPINDKNKYLRNLINTKADIVKKGFLNTSVSYEKTKNTRNKTFDNKMQDDSPTKNKEKLSPKPDLKNNHLHNKFQNIKNINEDLRENVINKITVAKYQTNKNDSHNIMNKRKGKNDEKSYEDYNYENGINNNQNNLKIPSNTARKNIDLNSIKSPNKFVKQQTSNRDRRVNTSCPTNTEYNNNETNRDFYTIEEDDEYAKSKKKLMINNANINQNNQNSTKNKNNYLNKSVIRSTNNSLNKTKNSNNAYTNHIQNIPKPDTINYANIKLNKTRNIPNNTILRIPDVKNESKGKINISNFQNYIVTNSNYSNYANFKKNSAVKNYTNKVNSLNNSLNTSLNNTSIMNTSINNSSSNNSSFNNTQIKNYSSTQKKIIQNLGIVTPNTIKNTILNVSKNDAVGKSAKTSQNKNGKTQDPTFKDSSVLKIPKDKNSYNNKYKNININVFQNIIINETNSNKRTFSGNNKNAPKIDKVNGKVMNKNEKISVTKKVDISNKNNDIHENSSRSYKNMEKN